MLGFFTKKRVFTLIKLERSKSVRRNKSFTIIELLVVLAIIALLVSVLVVSFGRPKLEANDTKRKVEIEQIMKAMELCYDDSDCGAEANQYISTTGGPNAVSVIDPYLLQVPTDPTDSPPYQYTWIDNSGLSPINKYCVYTKLQAPATDTWIAASHQGIRIDLDTEPSTIDCW